MIGAKKQGGKGLRAGERVRAQGPTRRSALAALAGLSAMALTGHANAQDPAPAAGDQSTPRRAEGADLQLVLAVDASGSVNARRFRLQQMGYAGAFRNQRVIKAISSGMWGAIAVTMFQWTGPHLQAQTVGWTRLASAKDCRAFGDFLEMSERHLFGGGTSISGAIDHGVELFGSCPWKAPRRVIDVSGDGYNTSGRDVAAARDEAVKRGVIINGLPILALEYDLDEHFRKEVIGGPGSFMISARTFEAFGEAVTRK
ncbi:MAG: DUF1194 domain-containing protein, partial [Alphaproteobacteria bacterium]|nr:DUF1194 domain-containing protein [Alphaproteobacteria bacterium]